MAGNFYPPTRARANAGSVLNILCGIWLIIAPFVLGYQDLNAALWNSIICGAAVLILAAARVSSPATTVGLSWLNLLLGIWLIISPFFLYAAAATPIWNCVILGILVGCFALWSAVATPGIGTPAGTGMGGMPPSRPY